MAGCLEDSPEFRASLQRAADEMDELGVAIEIITRGVRHAGEHANRMRESISRTIVGIRRVCALGIIDHAPNGIKSLIYIAEAAAAVLERLITVASINTIAPLSDALKDSVDVVRESKRSQEKIRDRFESAAARFGALPRLREEPLVREDAHNLLEVRKLYIASTVELVARVRRATIDADMMLSKSTAQLVSETAGAISLLNRILGPIATRGIGFSKVVSEEWMPEAEAKLSSEQALGNNLVAIVNARTVLDPVLSSPSVGYSKEKKVYKEGYLFVRRPKGLGAVWKRVYLTIKAVGSGDSAFYDQIDASENPSSEQRFSGCVFTQQTLASRRRGIVETAFVINILLIEARLSGAEADRRYCFEVATAKKVLLYQAESEEDLRGWLRAISKAKKEALLATGPNSINPLGTDSTRISRMPSIEHNISSDGIRMSDVESKALDQDMTLSSQGANLGFMAAAPTLLEEAPLPGAETGVHASSMLPEFSFSRQMAFDETIVLCTPVLLDTEMLERSIKTIITSENPIRSNDSSESPKSREDPISALCCLGRMVVSDRAIYFATFSFGDISELVLIWKLHIVDVAVSREGVIRVIISQSGQKFCDESPPAAPSITGYEAQSDISHSSSSRSTNDKTNLQTSIFFARLLAPDEQRVAGVLQTLLCNSRLTGPLGGATLVAFLQPSSGLNEDDDSARIQADAAGLRLQSPVLLDDIHAISSSEESPSLGDQNRVVECGCSDHLEQAGIDIIVPLSVDDTFNLLLGSSSPVFAEMNNRRGHKDVSIGDWLSIEELPLDENDPRDVPPHGAIEGRMVSFIVPVNNPLVKVKETQCFARHWILRKDLGSCYIVRQEARTPNVTYGDSFATVTLFCLTRAGSSLRTRVRTSAGVYWYRSPLVKGLIRSTVLKSQGEYFRIYTNVLASAVRVAISGPGGSPESDMSPCPQGDGFVPKSGLEESNPENQSNLLAVLSFLRSILIILIDRTSSAISLLKGPKSSDAIFLSVSSIILGISFVYCLKFVSTKPTLATPSGLIASSRPSLLNVIPEYEQYLLSIHSRSDEEGRISVNMGRKISNRIERASIAYSEVRREIKNLDFELFEAECRLAQVKYASWLADRLASCYADKRRDTSQCNRLEIAWTSALQPAKCK